MAFKVSSAAFILTGDHSILFYAIEGGMFNARNGRLGSKTTRILAGGVFHPPLNEMW